MQLSRRALEIQPSSTLAITSRAKELKSQGVDVVSFGAGEPDFPTPEHIVEAACKAAAKGETRYTPVSGIPKLREAVAASLAVEPNQVVVSCGAKHSLYNTFQVLLDPGDEVLIPIPYWVSYPEQVALAGGKSVFVEPGEDLLVTPESLEKAVTPKTKGLVLNSPSNPTGAVYSAEQLAAIGEFAEKHDLFIISDEIYQSLTYDGLKAQSLITLLPQLRDRTIVIDGVSKKYAMTGWRIGWAV
ncbi:MAG TPA: pyridoxal phosphate-dependent aminotransferase, partial [Bacillota bacterium]|nr:pyridoxal phosphate-dependent aminotransferase [Bacillota bacterium]